MILTAFIFLITVFFLRCIYAYKEKKALYLWSNLISGNIEHKLKAQNKTSDNKYNIKSSAIAPWSRTVYFYLNIFVLIVAVIAGFQSVEWYNLIIVCTILIFSIPYLSKFLPKEESKFWYDRFYNGLDFKRKHYEKIENFLKIETCCFLLEMLDEAKNFF